MNNARAATLSRELASAKTPAELISELTVAWVRCNKKRSVNAGESVDGTVELVPLLSQPAWPGTGCVETVTDDIPMILIPGMPAGQYLSQTRPLIAYTMAEMLVQMPHLASERANTELLRLVTLTVVTRSATWASLGRTPNGSPTVSASATRWSETHKRIIVKGARVGDGTEVWRHFLATLPGLLVGTTELSQAVSGSAPSLFLCGAMQLLRAGEAYAVSHVEEAVCNHFRATLPAEAFQTFKVSAAASLDTMAAAAIGGYSASLIQHVANDAAFGLNADRLIRPELSTRVTQRIDRLMSSSAQTSRGLAAGPTPVVAVGVTSVRSVPDDTASIVDTEDGYQDEPVVNSVTDYLAGLSNTSTPRPRTPIAAEEEENMRSFSRRVMQETEVINTNAAAMPRDETLHF